MEQVRPDFIYPPGSMLMHSPLVLNRADMYGFFMKGKEKNLHFHFLLMSEVTKMNKDIIVIIPEVRIFRPIHCDTIYKIFLICMWSRI